MSYKLINSSDRNRYFYRYMVRATSNKGLTISITTNSPIACFKRIMYTADLWFRSLNNYTTKIEIDKTEHLSTKECMKYTSIEAPNIHENQDLISWVGCKDNFIREVFQKQQLTNTLQKNDFVSYDGFIISGISSNGMFLHFATGNPYENGDFAWQQCKKKLRNMVSLVCVLKDSQQYQNYLDSGLYDTCNNILKHYDARD